MTPIERVIITKLTITTAQVYERAKCFGTSLIRNGAQSINTQLIGIMCSNGPEVGISNAGV